MKVRSVHTRALPASRETVSALLAGLAGPSDQLWPIERWPTSPIEFDGPLKVGARGGHGVIRYRIEDYEPGGSLAFRFEQGQGLEGIHRFDVEPLGPGQTRLTHTLDTRLTGATRLLKLPLLSMHNRLIEDLLDNAERATSGRTVESPPMPLWIRAANAVEAQLVPPAPGALRGRGKQVCGAAAPAGLTVLAALHAAWGLGWRWPGGSDSAFAERVIGTGELPPDWAIWTVAGLLLGAAGVVRTASTTNSSVPVRAGALAVGATLLARGGLGLATSLAGGLDTIYQRLDLGIYSPVCLVLGAGTLVAVRHAGSAPAQPQSMLRRSRRQSAPSRPAS